MKLTQAEAARAAGVSRTHILRAIKGGKLSAEKLDDGSVRIDASELLRVWPNADLGRARNSGNTAKQRHGNSHGDSGNDDGNLVLQALLGEIRQDRDRLRGELDRERQEQRQERDRLVRVIEEQAAAVRPGRADQAADGPAGAGAAAMVVAVNAEILIVSCTFCLRY
jgi:excisionase family DNA binding protein